MRSKILKYTTMRGAFTKTVALILCWKTVIILFSILATYALPLKLRFTPQDVFKQGFPYLLWIWGNFDGDHYMQIARTGYNVAELPFFPLHPSTLKIMHSVGIPYLIGGIILCHIAFFTAIYFMYQLLKIDRKQSLYYIMLIIILSFPTSYSYGAVYNDSLFLCMATITLYLGRKKQWILASIFGMLATYSRLNGLALFFYFIAEYALSVSPHYFTIRPFKKMVQDTVMVLNPKEAIMSGIVSILLIPLAYLSYLYYIQAVFGNWRLIYAAMYVWR